MHLPAKFSLSHWRAVYDSMQTLGDRLKRGRAKEIELMEGEEGFLESEIAIMSDNIRAYMDKVGLTMPKPLWQYDPRDERTWRSSEKFEFQHLCK